MGNRSTPHINRQKDIILIFSIRYQNLILRSQLLFFWWCQLTWSLLWYVLLKILFPGSIIFCVDGTWIRSFLPIAAKIFQQKKKRKNIWVAYFYESGATNIFISNWTTISPELDKFCQQILRKSPKISELHSNFLASILSGESSCSLNRLAFSLWKHHNILYGGCP